MRRLRPPPFVSRLSSLGIWHLAFGIVLIFLFFWKLSFTNLILARGDTFLYFYPYWDYRARLLLSGHLPLWNPYLFMGAPFLANSQVGVLYPLNWPLVFFSAPVAVKISILLHLIIALVGAQLFARRALGQSALGALLSAALFTLGGYLTSQVEHINQLQGLAWFPWLLLTLHHAQSSIHKSQKILHYLGLSILYSFQLLAGHTQSAFISLAGVALYAFILAINNQKSTIRNLKTLIPHPSSFILLPLALALLLSAAQLLPTLELSGQSLRGGGLPPREALSFSLDPRLLGRALLPGYAHGLFSEFVAYLGVTGLALAALGIKKTPQRLALLALVSLGLAFALGAYNPLYALLAALPPFNLFRVPARWLFLFAFGAAMLAGYGLDELSQRRLSLWHLRFGFLFPVLLILISPLANHLIPAGETGPLGPVPDLRGWLLPLLILAALTFFPLPDRLRAVSVFLLATSELFFAAQILPYNHPTTPDAYSSIRPAMTQLLAHSASSVQSVSSVDDRFLSMSALRFDPGDLAELHSELDPQLSPNAVYDAIVATKNKEVLSPNLPLKWGIPAVDGFDGGLLPLKHYAAFTELFTGEPSADGRLRENLTTAPDPRLLSLVNARYLITDKVDDAWIDNVFYDLQFTLTLTDGEASTIAYVPKFQATALGLVAETYSGRIQITFSDGSISNHPITQSRIHFDHPSTPTSLTLLGPLTLRGLSLIDERSGAFQSLTLGRYRLVHSGDVKIYQNLDVLPRAFVVPNAVVISDDAAARAVLADPNFDPASTVLLASAPNNPGHLPPRSGREPAGARRPSTFHPQVAITQYTPELIRLTADGPGYLLLTDADYPGWLASVDGSPAPILRADLMFRAVELPAGTHTVEFRFEPLSVKVGLWVSGISWVVVAVSLIVFRLHNKKADA
jgi:hypothetical protein